MKKKSDRTRTRLKPICREMECKYMYLYKLTCWLDVAKRNELNVHVDPMADNRP